MCCRTSNQCGGHFSKSSEEQTTSLVEKWRSSLAPPVNTISPVASELFSINQSSSVTPPIISKISYRSNVGSENEAKQDTVDDLSISNGTKDKDKLLAYPSQSVTDDLEVRPAGGKLSDTTHSIDDDDLQGRQLLNNNDVNKKSSSSTPKKRDKQKAKAKQTVPDPTSLGSRLNNGKDRKLTPRAKTAKQHLTALSDDDDSKLLSDEKNKKGRNLQTNLEQLRKKKKPLNTKQRVGAAEKDYDHVPMLSKTAKSKHKLFGTSKELSDNMDETGESAHHAYNKDDRPSDQPRITDEESDAVNLHKRGGSRRTDNNEWRSGTGVQNSETQPRYNRNSRRIITSALPMTDDDNVDDILQSDYQ